VARLSHSEVLLSKAGRELRMNWELTGSLWRDQARAEFEKTYLDELGPAVKSAAGAIERINTLLAEAIKACR
jgi:hypothetical protein